MEFQFLEEEQLTIVCPRRTVLERSVQPGACHVPLRKPLQKISRKGLEANTMNGRSSNLSTGAGEALPSPDFPTPPTPKRPSLESQRDQPGRERQEVIAFQREILAAVSRLADSQAQLVGVAKPWMALEEHTKNQWLSKLPWKRAKLLASVSCIPTSSFIYYCSLRFYFTTVPHVILHAE